MPDSSAALARRGRPFQNGSDPRRHRCTPACAHARYTFTDADRSAGFFSAIATLGVSIGQKLHTSGR
jgi:hypothetical protein